MGLLHKKAWQKLDKNEKNTAKPKRKLAYTFNNN